MVNPSLSKLIKFQKIRLNLVKESMWYSNGQKYKEGTYKDGKRIDSKSFGD